MIYSFEIKQEATVEFAEAYDWHKEQQDNLGEQFLIAVEQKLKKICKDPFIYKRSNKKFHEALTDTFPFLIVYFIDEANRIVIVTAIFHTSRNPKHKFKRIRLK